MAASSLRVVSRDSAIRTNRSEPGVPSDVDAARAIGPRESGSNGTNVIAFPTSDLRPHLTGSPARPLYLVDGAASTPRLPRAHVAACAAHGSTRRSMPNGVVTIKRGATSWSAQTVEPSRSLGFLSAIRSHGRTPEPIWKGRYTSCRGLGATTTAGVAANSANTSAGQPADDHMIGSDGHRHLRARVGTRPIDEIPATTAVSNRVGTRRVKGVLALWSVTPCALALQAMCSSSGTPDVESCDAPVRKAGDGAVLCTGFTSQAIRRRGDWASFKHTLRGNAAIQIASIGDAKRGHAGMGAQRLVSLELVEAIDEWVETEQEVTADGKVTSIEEARLRRARNKVKGCAKTVHHRMRALRLLTGEVNDLRNYEDTTVRAGVRNGLFLLDPIDIADPKDAA